MVKLFTVAAFIVAFVAVLLLTPLVRGLAFRLGALDAPKDERRVHKEPVALLGGVAIFLAIAAAVLVTCSGYRQTLPLLVCSALMVALGVVDDFMTLRPALKFGGQVLIAGLLWLWGVRVHYFGLPSGPFYLTDAQSAAVTIFWLVGITNAVNLIDGLDGLAAGVSAIAAATFCVMAWQHKTSEYVYVAFVAAAICGGCLGFLRYNFNPAKIFMGDAGAMTLGFLLAALSIVGLFKSAAAVAISVPVFVLGLPVLDTSLAILRRLAKGQAPWSADREHLHHRLMDKGWSQKKTVMVLYLISGLLCAAALLIRLRA